MDDTSIEPARLEERGWEALSTPGAGPEFHREVLDVRREQGWRMAFHQQTPR